VNGNVPGPMPRRGAAVAVALLASVVLAACGGHGAFTSSSSTAKSPGSSAGTAGGHALTQAQAKTFVAAVNLTAADLPGFTHTHEPRQKSSQAEKRLEQELFSCIGGGSGSQTAHPLAQGSSGNFRHQGTGYDVGVSSEVSVSSGSGADAAARRRQQAELRHLRSPHARTCLEQFLASLFSGKHIGGATVGHVSIQQGSPPAPGTAGGFGWRVTAQIEVRGVRLPYYVDILGFLYGPTEVTLLSTGLPVPLPAAIQERLFALLLTRATAFSH
jgi:hypothetical protein